MAHAATLVILKRLDDLLACVHDERSVGDHRLPKRLSCQHEDACPGLAREFRAPRLASLEHAKVAFGDSLSLRAGMDRALEGED